MSKQILVTIGWPLSYGGHLKSALALSKYLRRIGFGIHILAPRGQLSDAFYEIGAVIHENESINRKPPSNFGVVLDIMKLYRRYRFDIIHAQDPRSLYPSYMASAFLPVKFFYTEAGGPGSQIYFPSHSPIVSYSKEAADFIMNSFPGLASQITVIQARVDRELYNSLPNGFGKNIAYDFQGGINVFVAVRFDSGKKPWLDSLFYAIEILSRRNECMSFTIAGDGNLFEEFRNRSISINQSAQRSAISLIGPLYDVPALCEQYRKADIVVGSGRGILEAMASGRPAIVISPNGRGTIINRETANTVAEFNFSGRHVSKHPSISRDLVEQIDELAQDFKMREALGVFCSDYVASNYSAECGAKQLALLYESAVRHGYIEKILRLTEWVFLEGVKRRVSPIANRRL